MDASEALSTCELALRQLVSTVLTRKGLVGPDGMVKPEKLAQWRGRRNEERTRRESRGLAQVPDNELHYAHFYDLLDLLGKHWELFAPALGRKAETGALLKRFDDLRDTVAHSGALLPFEVDLLSGIAGEIRNRVTKYMSSQDPGGDYYPRIERVADSFGHSTDVIDTSPHAMTVVQTGYVLRPGEVVTFRGTGVDPQGRALTWSLGRGRSVASTPIVAEGDDVTLEWRIEDADVRDDHRLSIRLRAKDAIYHRTGNDDGSVLFIYRVVPPL